MMRYLKFYAFCALALLAFSHHALAAEASSSGEKGGPAYVRLTPINVSVINDKNKIDREVDIQLNLELAAGKTTDMFEAYRRNILDSFLFTLKGLYDDEYAGTEVPVDVLKDRLLKAADDITGQGFIHSVLIFGIGERRARG